MSGYKWDKRDISWFLVGKVTLGGHLYPLIIKAKKKLNQISYLVSIHLIFPFSYALFMSWINETLKPVWCKTCRMLIVDIISLCKVTVCLVYSILIP